MLIGGLRVVTHNQERAMRQLHRLALPSFASSPPVRPNPERSNCSKTYRRNHWLMTQLMFVISVPTHGIVVIGVEIGKDKIKRHLKILH